MTFALMIPNLPAIQHAHYVLKAFHIEQAQGKRYGFFRRLGQLLGI